MKITCHKSDLLSSINIVMKAVPTKSTMPILECIYMEAKADYIKFTANDMELGIETLTKGLIIDEGSIALSAKLLSDIVRKLPDNIVTIETDVDLTAKISCEKAKFNIQGKAGDEFPSLPIIERNKAITISQFTLKEMIRQTVFSISDNDINKIMSGELFQVNDKNMRIVSLDGHRISVRNVQLKESYEDVKIIVPGKTLNEISKILSSELYDEVKMYLTDKHILFEFDDTLVLSRLIEGEYYKIDQMLSCEYEIRVTINKKEFLNCIDRAILLVKENEKKPVIIDIQNEDMNLKITTTLGSMDENISINKEGKDILIAFNPKFLIDSLRVIDDETVDIYMINPKSPCFIKDAKESYVYLILPVNFTSTE